MQADLMLATRSVHGVALGLLLSIQCAVPAAFAQDPKDAKTAREWLDLAMSAAQELNYDGTFVYRNGTQMESMRIIHRGESGSGRSRLISLSGEAREVLRDQSEVTCILPESGAVMVGKSRSKVPNVLEFNDGFAEYYTLSAMGGGRIAGRKTQVVTVKPKDNYRYGYRVWVDQDTGLLLRSELVDEGGTALEQFEFTSVSTPTEIPDELLRPGISQDGLVVIKEPEPAAQSQSEWEVSWLPEGFVMTDQRAQPGATHRMPLEHLAYSDGVAMLSVFIEKLDSSGEPLEGASGMGALNAFGSMVDGYQVTVVGEVPQRTVQAVAESIRRK